MLHTPIKFRFAITASLSPIATRAVSSPPNTAKLNQLRSLREKAARNSRNRLAKLKTPLPFSNNASMADQSSPQSPLPSSPESTMSSTAASVVTAPEIQDQAEDRDPDGAISQPSSRPPSPGRLRIPARRSDSRSPSRPRTNPNDPYPHFLLQSKSEIKKRFESLEWTQRQLPHDNALSEEPYDENLKKIINSRNRYVNVDAYPYNRVLLQVDEDACDYINASPITLERFDGDEQPSRCIATQGPKDITVGHFWHMIFTESTSTAIIVMLTKVAEGGREKCADYLPSHEPASIYSNEHLEEPDYTVIPGTSDLDATTGCYHRDLTLRHEATQETRRIMHYAFESWPDFSVPDANAKKQLAALVNEVRRVTAENPDSPRVVHCSAGVGRSGTFIALDFLFRLMREERLKKSTVDEKQDPIYNAVEQMRKQRVMMVQNEVQYALIYEVVREEMLRMWDSGELGRES
ncbi:hypothetical protein EJ05DRAFT_473387 [Pseudovirgaria hyperparasitica]|uniref:Phosphatases II n=1 Tax=Pseudovirgaria hyperparasitica TaxID=470096 RepID=A0A6A6WDY0_9PEZI|nr:uncharacterized protein EJ05DRAFT_473387 [Pseudovirgaria hyperparasitica]KAF2760775.1 hypothetical protein EJ05DRAFT_473387 [Pseudovirgaria hyperparasitica]